MGGPGGGFPGMQQPQGQANNQQENGGPPGDMKPGNGGEGSPAAPSAPGLAGGTGMMGRGSPPMGGAGMAGMRGGMMRGMQGGMGMMGGGMRGSVNPGVDSGLPPEAKEAAKAFNKSCDDARAKLLAKFDTALDQLAKIKGSTEQRLKLIEAVKAEKKRFDNSGLIPWSEPMRPYLAKYFAAVSAAEGKLRRAYNSLIHAQRRAKNERMVADLQADLKSLIAARLVARWRVIRDGRTPGYIVALYSNGIIHDGNGNATSGTWVYSEGVLIFRWPDPKAPGGAWLDKSNVSADGTAYAGANNSPLGMRPAKFTGIYLNPD